MTKVEVTTVELADLQRELLWLKKQAVVVNAGDRVVQKLNDIHRRLDEWMLRSLR